MHCEKSRALPASHDADESGKESSTPPGDPGKLPQWLRLNGLSEVDPALVYVLTTEAEIYAVLALPEIANIPQLARGATPAQSKANIINWLDTLLLLPGTNIYRAVHNDGSLSTVYEKIPESRYPDILQRLANVPLNDLSGACHRANLSAGHCYSVHATRGVVTAKHFCVGPFISNS